MKDTLRLGRRVVGGFAIGRAQRLEPGHSLLVVGPTQVGKTSSLVIPSILSWPDALVVTSVKRDVVAATVPWRAALGHVQVLDPGAPDGLTWDPLEGVATMRDALRVARDLTLRSSGHGDTEFWNTLAVKLLGALFVRAVERGLTIVDVALVLESRDLETWSDDPSSVAARVIADFLAHETRTIDGVITTAETMLLPWRFDQPRARVRSVVDGAHTLYLCSPRGEQAHYQSLFAGALRGVLDEQQRRVDRATARPLLLVLDEAAVVAPLDELDELAATLAGLSVTLITVVQDFAQLVARWGPRAPTIVNNHATRLVMAGLSDPTAATYVPEVAPSIHPSTPSGPSRASRTRPAPSLRERPRGTALVVAGNHRPVTIRLRPWWRDSRLRARGGPASAPGYSMGVNDWSGPATAGTGPRARSLGWR